jgi:hypothetical protein
VRRQVLVRLDALYLAALIAAQIGVHRVHVLVDIQRRLLNGTELGRSQGIMNRTALKRRRRRLPGSCRDLGESPGGGAQAFPWPAFLTAPRPAMPMRSAKSLA